MGSAADQLELELEEDEDEDEERREELFHPWNNVFGLNRICKNEMQRSSPRDDDEEVN